MRWTTKARAFRILSSVPGGPRLYYLFQRHLTRSLRIGTPTAQVATRRAGSHAAAWQRFGDVPLADARIFEFGAGWHLGGALALARCGARHQLVTDLHRVMRPRLVREMVAALGRLGGEPLPTPQGDLTAYLATLGIEYRAPFDTTRTGLPDDSVDVVLSAHVLEHVAAADLPVLLAECRRILRPGGVASFEINYQDHYSGGDPSIGPFHFLRFDDEEWRRYDSGLHHQNRLRHGDFSRLFAEAGFDVLDARPRVSAADVDEIRRDQLAPRFAAMPVDDVAVRMATFALTPRA